MQLNWRQMLYLTPAILLVGTLSGAEDWSTCQSDLNRVKRIAQNASDAAQELESLENELKDKRSELQNCINEPRTYDIYRDRCQSQRREYDYERQDFTHKKTRLQGELAALESRLRSVQVSCDYKFSFGVGARPQQTQQKKPDS